MENNNNIAKIQIYKDIPKCFICQHGLYKDNILSCKYETTRICSDTINCLLAEDLKQINILWNIYKNEPNKCFRHYKKVKEEFEKYLDNINITCGETYTLEIWKEFFHNYLYNI